MLQIRWNSLHRRSKSLHESSHIGPKHLPCKDCVFTQTIAFSPMQSIVRLISMSNYKPLSIQLPCRQVHHLPCIALQLLTFNQALHGATSALL